MDRASMVEDAQAMPRVGGLPLVGCLPGVLRGQFRFLEAAVARHGTLLELDLGPTRVVIVADAAAAEHVLIDGASRYDKGGDIWDALREAMGLGLAMSEGALWRRQRTLMQPRFQRRLVEGYRGPIADTVAQALSGLATGRPVDVAKWCDELLAAITVRVLFGSDLDRARIDELRRVMAGLFDALLLGLVTRTLPRWLPAPGRRRLEHARRAVDEHMMPLIAERRRQPGRGDDLLGTLVRAADESGAMSDRQLRDEAMTIYVAGYETTGAALAWTLWLLASHPLTCARLQAELDVEAEPAPLLHACIREGLRLYPPAPFIPRRAVVDDVLGGFGVGAGTPVLVSPWLIHRDPRIWPEPHAFEPHRFTDDPGPAAPGRPRLAWIPFGAGQRVCIGKALALLELEQALRLILRRFTPTVDQSRPPPRPRMSSTLRSSRGIWLTLRPR